MWYWSLGIYVFVEALAPGAGLLRLVNCSGVVMPKAVD